MARTATVGERFARISNSRLTNRALLGAALIVLSTACGMGGGTPGGSTTSGITYSGPTSWDIIGPQGGPFTNTSLIVVLDNPGSTAVSWSATSVPTYVQLDQLSGTTQPNTTARIHADLNAAVAQALAPGLYRETLTFHDDSEPAPDIDIACTLLVQTLGSSSDLQPATNFASQGAAGGPFVPDGTTYTLWIHQTFPFRQSLHS